MRGAGYNDLERGVRGSTAGHLSVLDYKIKQDTEHLDGLAVQISGQKTALGEIDKELSVVYPIKAEIEELSAIGRKKLLTGKVEMNADDYDKLQSLAKEGLTAQRRMESLYTQMSDMRKRIWSLTDELNNLYEKTKDFFTAVRLAPEKVRALFTDIFSRRKEAVEQQKSPWTIKVGGRDTR